MTVLHRLNTSDALAPALAEGRIPLGRVWWMLSLRSALSFGMLLVVALGLRLAGRESVFAASSAWWLWFVTVTNLVCLAQLVRLSRIEGMGLRDIYFISRSTWRTDLVWFLLALGVTAIVAQPPGTLLARALWGDASYPNTLLIQPLPVAAIYPLFILMPTTHALAELPIYWGYVAPRLVASGLPRWRVIALVGAVLSLQHMFFAFQLDWRYDLWLALKYLPFAVWTGIVLDRQPSLMPYLMAVHLVIDALLPVLVLMVSRGMSLSG